MQVIAKLVRMQCTAPLHGAQLPFDILVPAGTGLRDEALARGYRWIRPYELVCPRCVARIASDD